MDFVDRQCFSKSEDVAYLSRLTRQLPIESVRKVKSGGYIHGKTTVVNFIILDNGLCWYRYVGDSYLFLIRDGIIKQLTTNRLSQSNSSIEAIGLSSNVSPKEAKNIFWMSQSQMRIYHSKFPFLKKFIAISTIFLSLSRVITWPSFGIANAIVKALNPVKVPISKQFFALVIFIINCKKFA